MIRGVARHVTGMVKRQMTLNHLIRRLDFVSDVMIDRFVVTGLPFAVPTFLHKSVGLIPTEKWIRAVAGVELSHPGMRAYQSSAARKVTEMSLLSGFNTYIVPITYSGRPCCTASSLSAVSQRSSG
jgi:hypothetical protein